MFKTTKQNTVESKNRITDATLALGVSKEKRLKKLT